MKYCIVLVVYCLLACSSLPKVIEPSKTRTACLNNIDVTVVSHGWHTGLVLPAKDLNRLIPALNIRFPRSQYYEIGWGDSGFYQTNQITTKLTLRAMFWSLGSVLHVVGFNESPHVYFHNSDTRDIQLTSEGYQHLLFFIQSSFMTDTTGQIISQKRGIYGDSQFYTGIGTYHLFNTCNSWTAKALYSAGLTDMNPVFKLTASSVMNFLATHSLLHAVCQATH